MGQAFIVSYYARGERRARDCDGDFYPTRCAAREAGQAMVEAAAYARREKGPDWPCAWIVRYTVRRIFGDF